MRVGVPRETKTDENRIAVTPAGVATLVSDGHEVYVEAGAGAGSRIDDGEYLAAGALIVDDVDKVWAESDLVCKVKEPQPPEFRHLRPDLTLFTYLHLAAYPAVAEALIENGTTGIGYETVMLPDGTLPLLAPMSQVAGRMATQVGAHLLERRQGGRGILLGGVPGVEPASVVIVGGGMAGTNAAQMAVGLGAAVSIFDLSPSRLAALDAHFAGRAMTRMANPHDVSMAARAADLVIGAVLLPGARAPRVLTREDIRAMRPGSVVVDIAIDQGGCFETSHETKHSDPTYVIDEVVHYAVGNIPGAVPRTSTFALSNATFPYLRALANLGVDGAIAGRPELAGGVNVRDGQVVNEVVAAAMSAAE